MTTARPDDLVEVRLLHLPVEHHHRTAEHIDELLREFAFISADSSAVPDRLLALRDEMSARFDAFTAQPLAELERALADGTEHIDLTLELPRLSGELSQVAIELLDQADEFCRSGEHLLTLAAPDGVVRYRRWFFGEFVRQCAGRPAEPWRDDSHAPEPSRT